VLQSYVCTPTAVQPAHLSCQQRLLVLLLPLRHHPSIPRPHCCCSADAIRCTSAGPAVYVVAIYQLLQQRQ
jgi:hypothetical protein